MNTTLLTLALIFAQFSLLAFGGGNSVLPEMQRQVVAVHGWMSDADFAALFALARAAPGPNMMIVPLIGWHVAGWQGLLVTSGACFAPSSILVMGVLHAWRRFEDRPWRRHLQAGLVPVTVGLVATSAWLVGASVATTPLWVLVLIAAALGSLLTRWHPLWLLAGGALVGVLFGG